MTEKALRYANTNYLEICKRRLKGTANINYSIEDLRKAIMLSAILHDTGKATDRYQQQFNDECALQNSKAKLSFYLHEITSAVITKRVCEHNNIDLPLSFFVVSSVLQHLHTMRSIDRRRIVNNAVHRLDTDETYRTISYSQQLLEMAKNICEKHHITIDLKVDLFSSINSEEIEGLFKWLREIIQDRNYRWPKLYVLFLNPVVIGDNLDAEKNRKQSEESSNRRPFMKELAITLGE